MSTRRTWRWMGLTFVLVFLQSPALTQPAVGASVEEDMKVWRDLMKQPETPLDAILLERVGELPSLEWITAKSEIVRSQAEVVDTLPDPMVRVGVAGLPITRWTLNDTPMSGIDMGVSWTLPVLDLPEARGEAKRALADALASEVGEKAVSIELKATQLYWAVYRIDRIMESLDEIEVLLVDLNRLAEARYGFGTTSEADVLLAGLSLDRLNERRLSLLKSRSVLVAEFNTLLERDERSEVVPPSALNLELMQESDDALLERALDNRPVFATLKRRHEAIDVRRRVAELEAYPMFSFGLSYRLRFDTGMDPVEGEDFVGAFFGMSLPFYASKRSDAALAGLDAEDFALQSQEQEIIRGLRAHIVELTTTLRQLEGEVRFIEDVGLPNARATFETLIAVYPTGGTDFFELLKAGLRIFELEVQRRDHIAHHRTSRAMLEEVVGGASISIP